MSMRSVCTSLLLAVALAALLLAPSSASAAAAARDHCDGAAWSTSTNPHLFRCAVQTLSAVAAELFDPARWPSLSGGGAPLEDAADPLSLQHASWGHAADAKVQRAVFGMRPEAHFFHPAGLEEGAALHPSEASSSGSSLPPQRSIRTYEQHISGVVTGLHRTLHHRIGNAAAAAQQPGATDSEAGAAPQDPRAETKQKPAETKQKPAETKQKPAETKQKPAARESRRILGQELTDDDATETKRRAMEAQASLDAASYVRPRRFCTRGIVTAPQSQGFFTCPDPARNITNAVWAALPAADRAKCTYMNIQKGVNQVTSSTLRCVCSQDMLLFSDVLGAVDCVERIVGCSSVMGGGYGPNCYKAPYATPDLDMKHCLVTTRRNPSLRLESRTTCVFSPLDRTYYADVGQTILSAPDSGEEDLPLLVLDDSSAATAEVGTYTAISTGSPLFTYVLKGNSSQPLWLTEAHGLVGGGAGKVELQLFNFLHFGDTSQRKRFPLSFTSNVQYLTGQTPFVVTLNLSAVPAAFVYGNRLYGEMGLVASAYTVQPFSIARFFVDFSDMPVGPATTIAQKLPLTTVIVIVVVVLVFCGLVAYVLWIWCHQPSRIDDGLGSLLLSDASSRTATQLPRTEKPAMGAAGRVPGSPVVPPGIASEDTRKKKQ